MRGSQTVAYILCFLATGSLVLAQEFKQPLKINTSPGPEWADGMRAKGQGVPTIERSPNGRLWVAFRSEYSKPQMERSVMLVTSEDDGETWSGPKLVIHENGENASPFDPVLWHDPTGRLWFFWSQRPEFDVWAIQTDDSNPENPVWSRPEKLMAVFTEQDIIAGGFVTEGSRSQVMVNNNLK